LQNILKFTHQHELICTQLYILILIHQNTLIKVRLIEIVFIMATPSEKLSASIEVLKSFQDKHGVAVIKSGEMTRTHKDRLVSKGFLIEVIKGWYISVRPDLAKGDSTSWYTCFWKFVSIYFNDRFGSEWCLSPEQSLLIHSGNFNVPKQLLVRSPRAGNNKMNLIHNTSFIDLRSSMPPNEEIEEKDGLFIFSLASALIASSPGFYTQHPNDARTAIAMIKDSSEVLAILLNGGHSVIAGRLAGAFRNVGRDRIAVEIISGMRSADYDARELDPFSKQSPAIIDVRQGSPSANRVKLMWYQMRQYVIEQFPAPPDIPGDIDKYLANVDDKYKSDAYHSLSIEGYRVTPDLIEKVKSGKWNPEKNFDDTHHIDAMAARGYWLAFQAVKVSIKEILKGQDAGKVAENDHAKWYRQLFSPSVTAGILKPSDLAGYRNGPVYIKGSMHIPPSPEALRDAMPVLFELLREEQESAVRAVLGHFIFVYLHPYMDGNGRIGRFLMNVMLASGGYPWTVIPMVYRNRYMDALEKASVEQEIKEFTDFLSFLVQEGLEDKSF